MLPAIAIFHGHGLEASLWHDEDERYTNEQQMATMVAAIPMGRAGVPEECVGTVFYLASNALSGYVTGQIIEVNGGQYMP